jgi:phage terminase Nu1 subunit (DNA packaging protein)
MGYRHPNPRLAKIHYSYSVEDLARLFHVHKNTVRSWCKQGLVAIDDKRPSLFRGYAVRRYLAERRARTKQSCGPGRIYCLPCRAPKVPAGRIAECVQTDETTGSLQGICPDCNRMIYRRLNPQKLDAVRGDLDVTVTRARLRIEETLNPNVNCDSAEGDHR